MKVSYFILTILSFFMMHNAKASKIDQAYASLKEYDYFKSKALFSEELSKNKVPAAFGLSIIHYRNDNPFHNLDTSIYFVKLSIDNFYRQPLNVRTKYLKYGITYDSLCKLRLAIISKKFSLLKFNNQIETYDKFIKSYPYASEIDLVIKMRDSIVISVANKLTSSKSFDSIMKRYPTNIYKDSLGLTYQSVMFKEETKNGTIKEYLSFISKNPESPYIIKAQEKIFEIETKGDSVELYKRFIEFHPNFSNIDVAWRKLYYSFMIDYSDDRINRFKRDFPHYPFKDELIRDIQLIETDFFPYKKDSLFGWINSKGNILYETEFESLSNFSEGLAMASKKGLYGYIDKLNSIAIPYQYTFATDFQNGRAIVEKNGKSGVINRVGKYILPLEFSELGSYSHGLIYGLKDSFYYYYDLKGKQLSSLGFDNVFPFENGKAKVVYKGKQGVIDTLIQFLVEPKHNQVYYYSDTLLVYCDSVLFGIKALNGTILVNPTYEFISPLVDGRSIFILNNKIGYLNEVGSKVIKNIYEVVPNYSKVCHFSNGYAKVSLKGKLGIIDKTGKYILPPEFNGLGEVGSIIAFDRGKKWGFMNLLDKSIVIEPKYDYSTSFMNGYAIVDKDGLQGVINEKSKWIISPDYKSIKFFPPSYFIVNDGLLNGLFSLDGDKITDIEYKNIVHLNENYLMLYYNNELCFLNIHSKKMIKPTHIDE